MMSVVRVSSSFRIVIPAAVRRALRIRPFTRFRVFVHEGRIDLVRIRRPQDLRGFLRGMDLSATSEPDRV